jgi:hypothetical protein
MDESDALCIARGAVQDAMKAHKDNPEHAIQALQEMADKDPKINQALMATGFLSVQAEQAQKH